MGSFSDLTDAERDAEFENAEDVPYPDPDPADVRAYIECDGCRHHPAGGRADHEAGAMNPPAWGRH